ncbi:MAG: hypothetical protein J6Q69_07660 [Clostridia bacterium]|nr:hypothetical protein [Clostridia bacterium]
MIDINSVKEQIAKNPEYAARVYAYGFVFTECEPQLDVHPFYGLWQSVPVIVGGEVCGYLTHHPKTGVHTVSGEECSLVLVGHAYDPFAKESCEDAILGSLIKSATYDGFINTLNNVSGVFALMCIRKDGLVVFGDPTGMQTVFYGIVDGKRYVCSHINLIGDLLGLETSDYVKRLVSYKYFPLLGSALPSDVTSFENLKRLIPNHYVKLTDDVEIKRFFEIKRLELSTEEIAERVKDILSESLSLIADKWQRPAISLTGGCDSKTTLACANGSYDRFSYFSYISNEEERVDAEAAHKICDELGLPHTVYEISNNDSSFSDIECHKSIIFRNAGSARKTNPNDLRKRCFFDRTDDFDVEIKSWCSEVGRAYYSKRFAGRKRFGKPTARKCTTMYKFFLHNRRLVRETDKLFGEYISRYMPLDGESRDLVEWQDRFFWEFRMSSWNGNVITGEHRYSFDIAIPYNNRVLLQLLLSAPLSARINDAVYEMIRERANPAVDRCGIAVTNVKHTSKRAKAENLYYILHTKVPF